jgi:predicted RNA-binding Zn ribbon-like protein
LPVEAAPARLLAVVAEAMAEGTWTRLKACREPSCRSAYYDHSRNRRRTWCSMDICGNRAKARASHHRKSTRL